MAVRRHAAAFYLGGTKMSLQERGWPQEAGIHAHSTPDPESPDPTNPDSPPPSPDPDDVPAPSRAPVQEPDAPMAPVKAGRAA
jgi:hypothetical protein